MAVLAKEYVLFGPKAGQSPRNRRIASQPEAALSAQVQTSELPRKRYSDPQISQHPAKAVFPLIKGAHKGTWGRRDEVSLWSVLRFVGRAKEGENRTNTEQSFP